MIMIFSVLFFTIMWLVVINGVWFHWDDLPVHNINNHVGIVGKIVISIFWTAVMAGCIFGTIVE